MSAPDQRHHVSGDHHGDEATCTWCGAQVVVEQGRLVEQIDPTPHNGFEGHHG